MHRKQTQERSIFSLFFGLNSSHSPLPPTTYQMRNFYVAFWHLPALSPEAEMLPSLRETRRPPSLTHLLHLHLRLLVPKIKKKESGSVCRRQAPAQHRSAAGR